MGMRMAENVSYYIFTFVSLTYVDDYLDLDKDADPEGAADRRGGPVRRDPALRRTLRQGRPPPALPGRRGRRRRLGLRVLRPARHQAARSILLAIVGRPVLPRADVRARRRRSSPSCSARRCATPARRSATSSRRSSPARWRRSSRSRCSATSTTKNTSAVGIYVAVASVITVVAVLCAKETRATSLRHDRVVEARTSDGDRQKRSRRSDR